MLLLPLLSPAFAAEVTLTRGTAPLDGTVVSTPMALTIGGEVSGLTAGHSYRVIVTKPDGTRSTAVPNAAGRWKLAAAVPLVTVTNGALQTVVAELRDTTGGGSVTVDRDLATLVDLTPFNATWGSRNAGEGNGLRVHVTEAGVDDLDPYIAGVAESLGYSIDDVLNDAIPAGSELPAEDADSCSTATDAGMDVWSVIWTSVTTLVELLVPAAAPVIEVLDAFVESSSICFGGVYPVINEVTVGPADYDFTPRTGGLTGSVTLGEIHADITLSTSLSVTIDAVSLADDLLDLAGVDLNVAGTMDGLIQIPGDGNVTFSLIDLGVCQAYYDTAAGGTADLGFQVGASPRSPDSVAFADTGRGSLGFASASLSADGACGWGIFSGRLDRSQDNVERAITEQFGDALGVGDGQDSWIAHVLDEAYGDVTPTDPVELATSLSAVSGVAPTGLPSDPGGLVFTASTRSTGSSAYKPGLYDQPHAPVAFVDVDRTGVPYGLGVAVAASAVNQALSAGMVDHMAYAWHPTWNELGQCAFAPSSGSCDDPATLDGAALARIYAPLGAAVGTHTVSVAYVPALAPFTAVEVDPPGAAHGYYFLGSYRMQLVDDVTGEVWVEMTGGASTDAFGLTLSGNDAVFGYPTPAMTYTVTSAALATYPSDAALTSALGVFLEPMAPAATEGLLSLPALEMSACASAGCSVSATNSFADRGSFHAYGTLY